MGLYDQFLANTQHGLGLGDQYAMQNANRPTMADVFMDRFRQAGQDQLQRQVQLGNQQMNMAYKKAQEEKMAQDAETHRQQRYLTAQDYISKTKNPNNYNEVLAGLNMMGLGDFSAAIPQGKYETVPAIDITVPRDFENQSIAEDKMEDTTTIPETKSIIPGSDYGAENWLKQQALDNAMKRAYMSEDTKRYLASTKANDAKSAVGKIMQDLRAGQISPELAKDAITKATIFFDPAKAALIGQGLDPSNSGLPISTFRQTPGALNLPGQPPASPAQPVQPVSGPPAPQQAARPVPAQPRVTVAQPVQAQPATKQEPKRKPGVVPFDNGKARVERDMKAKEAKSMWSAATRDVDLLVEKIGEALEHEDLDKVTGAEGKMYRMSPFESGPKTVSALLDSIKAQAGLNKIADLKKSGAGLGQVTESEHTLVQDAGSTINYDKIDSKTLRQNLKKLRANALKLKASLDADAKAALSALGAGDLGEHVGKTLDRKVFDGLSPAAQKLFIDGGGTVK